jgi:adenylate cyclase
VILSLLLIAATLVLWHFKVEPLYKLSLQVNDIKYYFNDYTPSDEIVFVEIDEKSVTQFGRWPWDRELFAKALQPLSQAQTVIFDMVFSETTSKAKDEALASSIEHLDNTICGFFLRNNSTKVHSNLTQEILQESALHRIFVQHAPFIPFLHAELNIPEILEMCTLNGVFSTLSDSDSLFRQYPIAFLYNDFVYPSLGIQALRYVLNQDITIEQKNNSNTYDVVLNNQNLHMNENGFVQLNYYKRDTYQTLSFAQLLDENFNEALIEDKIVILGISEAGVSDIRATPLGQIPGPLLHYTFISNFLQEMVLKQNKWLEFALIVLFALIPIGLSSILKTLNYRIIAYALSISLIVLICIVAYKYYHLWLDLFYILFAHIVLLVFNGVYIFKTKDLEAKFLEDAFKNYLSQDLLNEIIKDPSKLQLGGAKRRVTIIFTDIRGFTNLSEKVSSEELIKVLELYFTPMTQLVFKNKGTLDKYIGDAIMAFYNAPIDVPHHEACAVRTALQMLEELKNVNKKLNSLNLPSIDFGAGINTGEAIVGNIGSKNRFDYSVVGDSVNVASRVEGLCKQYKAHIVITEFTKNALDEKEFLMRELDEVQLRGKEHSTKIYQVLPNTLQNQSIKKLSDVAMQAYHDKSYEKAKTLFEQCYDEYGDETAKILIQKLLSEQASLI